MYITILILIVGFLIFLYNLYFVSHDDFVIVRKDINIQKIFDLAFMTAFFSLFFARVFYVLFNPSPIYMHILSFVAFPYFPGLSLIGAIVGGIGFSAVYSKFNKLPIGRIIDLFTHSFLGVLPLGFLAFYIAFLGKTDAVFNLLFLTSFVTSLVFVKIIYKFAENGEIKDGSFTLIFTAVFSLLYFLVKLFSNLQKFSFFERENIFLFVVIFSSLILLLNQEIMEKFLDKK